MKYTLTLFSILVSFSCFYSQGGVSINASGVAPNPNSMLDVSSNTKGVLITRLTTAARTTLGGALGLPDNGMLVYDKDLLAFYFWDGTMWVEVGNGAGTGDNWGTDVVNISGTNITGDGTLANPLTISDEIPIGGTLGQVLSTNGAGIYSWINDNSGTDAQDLTLITNVLSLTNDATTVDLSGYLDNTDDQNIQNLAIDNTTNILTVGIENGTSQTVDLSVLKDHDWYEVGGTSQPDDINDDIFTQGKVGIGVVAPSHKLSVVDQGTNGGIFLSSNGNGGEISAHDNTHFNVTNGRTTNATISMPHYGLALPEVPGSAETWISGNSGVSLFSAGLERVRLNSLGNVGIGVTSPNARFHVFSTPVGDNLNDETTVMMLQTNSTGNTSFLEAKTRRHTAGNDWYGTNMRLQRRVDATGQGFIDFGIDGNSIDYGLGFGTRNGLGGTQQTRMVIDNNGNVGIGTKSPNNKLHVYDQIDGVFAGLVVDNRKTYGVGTGTNETSRILMSLSETTFPNPNNRVMGYVESGTFAETTSSESFMAFGTRNLQVVSEKMRILHNGNVGIGTTTPTEKLHVQGSVRIVDGTQGIGKVLTSDATGKGSWVASDIVLSGTQNLTVPAILVDTYGFQASVFVNFGQTFSTPPVVVCTYAGGAVNWQDTRNYVATNVTTTGFTLQIIGLGGPASNAYTTPVNWIASGY